MTEFDPVNKPKHYNSHPSGIEVIEITRHLPFDIGNAVKYLFRHGLKGNSRQDLEKALWYLKDHCTIFGETFDINPIVGHKFSTMLVAESPESSLDYSIQQVKWEIAEGEIGSATAILEKTLDELK